MTTENEEFDDQLWGDWECPECGETHSDPESIQETTCVCGVTVVLGCVDEWSGRTAKAVDTLSPRS